MFTKFITTESLNNTDKPVAVLIVYILNDGNGDYYYLKSLYEYLEEQQITQRCTVVVLIGLASGIGCSLSTKIIIPWLKDHHLQNFFIGDYKAIDQFFFEDAQLLNFLNKASQIVTISTNVSEIVEKYRARCPQDCLLTTVGEHERSNLPLSLGLSKGKAGLKLKRIDRISPIQFTNELQHSADPNDQHFLKALSQENSDSLDTFHENFIFIPAYFNTNPQFNSFLFFLISKSFTEKNIAIFLSGDVTKALLIYGQPLFSQYNIRQIEVIRLSSQKKPIKETIVIDTANTVVIQIYCGFYLSDPAYLNAFRQALIAGVLGDNGFEMAVSCRTFPFYQSTNVGFKYLTGEALCLDIMPKITPPFPLQLIQHYTNYFSFSSLGYFKKIEYVKRRMNEEEKYISSEELLTRFSSCGDVRALIENWERVAEYLIEHHNFYPRFLDMFTAGLRPIRSSASQLVAPPAHLDNKEYIPFELLYLLTQVGNSQKEKVDDLLTNHIPPLVKYATHFAMVINALDKDQMVLFCKTFKSYLPALLGADEHLFGFIEPYTANIKKMLIFREVLKENAEDFLSQCSLKSIKLNLKIFLSSHCSEDYRQYVHYLIKDINDVIIIFQDLPPPSFYKPENFINNATVLKKFVPNFIRSSADFETVLRSLPDERFRTEVYELTRDHIPHLIHSYRDLSRIISYLTPEQGAEIFSRAQERISLQTLNNLAPSVQKKPHALSHPTKIPRQSLGFDPTLFATMLRLAPDAESRIKLTEATDESNRLWHLFDNAVQKKP